MSFSDLSDPPTVSDSDASDNDSQSGKDNDDQIKIVDPVEINDGLVTYYVNEPIGKRTCLFGNGLSVCVCVFVSVAFMFVHRPSRDKRGGQPEEGPKTQRPPIIVATLLETPV